MYFLMFELCLGFPWCYGTLSTFYPTDTIIYPVNYQISKLYTDIFISYLNENHNLFWLQMGNFIKYLVIPMFVLCLGFPWCYGLWSGCSALAPGAWSQASAVSSVESILTIYKYTHTLIYTHNFYNI
jgi:hypothetical protein